MAKKFSDAVKEILSRSDIPRNEANAAIKNLIELTDAKDPRIEDDRAPAKTDETNLIAGNNSLSKGFTKGTASLLAGLLPDTDNKEGIREILKPKGAGETIGNIIPDILVSSKMPMFGATKKASTVGKVLNTGGNMALQSGALSAVKGNDANTIKNEAITGGVLGSALHGAPELLKAGAKKYIRGALKGTDVTSINNNEGKLIETALQRVLQTVPKESSSANNLSGNVFDRLKRMVTPATENMSPNSILNQSEKKFYQKTFDESDIATKLNGSVGKDKIVDIFKTGTEGAMVPSARAGRLGNRNVNKFDSDNFVERYKNSGKHLEEIIDDYFSRSNPEIVTGSTTRNVIDEVDSPILNSKGEAFKTNVTRKETTPTTRLQYFEPATNKFAPMDKRRPQEVSLEDVLSMARNLEVTKPMDISKSFNPLYTPTQPPTSRNAVEGLFDELGQYPQLANAITKTDNEVVIGRMLKKLFGGQEEVETLLPYARGVSGLTHNNLPYAGTAVLTATKPLKLARQTNKNSDDFIRTLLPQLLKAVPALSQQSNRE